MEKRDTLHSIATQLIYNDSFASDIGLYSGKMGMILFLFMYSRYINDSMYSDFANDLIDEIYEDININQPYDFKDGISGICWGFLFLMQNNFVEAQESEVFCETDEYIMDSLSSATIKSEVNYHLLFEGLTNYFINRKEFPYLAEFRSLLESIIAESIDQSFIKYWVNIINVKQKFNEIVESTNDFMIKTLNSENSADDDCSKRIYLSKRTPSLASIGLRLMINE